MHDQEDCAIKPLEDGVLMYSIQALILVKYTYVVKSAVAVSA